jgi:uncharacterized protein (DUF3820 family)
MSDLFTDSKTIIPFGKYKGQDIIDILERDDNYIQWLLAQPWFRKFDELHNAILTRGVKIEDTPEHNSMQIRFLDCEFQHAVFKLTNPHFNHKIDDFRVKFEQRGIDVVLYADYGLNSIYLPIELKPVMGEDYPSVMRQMKRLHADILIIREYIGQVATEEQLRKMFAANNQMLIFEGEIDELLNQ